MADNNDEERVEEAFEGIAYCGIPQVAEPDFGPDMAPSRLELLTILAKKWVNGTILHYYFFDQETDGEFVTFSDGTREWRSWVGAEEQREVVRLAFQSWKDLGIGLEFEEVPARHEAEIRIGFMRGDGSWSYLGLDAIDLDLSVNERTMNFGWDLVHRRDGMDTALHEIGHAMGFPHEHQNPNTGIVWDDEVVYHDLAQPPNEWSREKTFYNILRKLPRDQVQGSNWDPNSIMHYSIGAGWILEPGEFNDGLDPAGGLSDQDKMWARTFYPAIRGRYPELKLFEPEMLELGPGNQKNLVIEPQSSRRYTIQTLGLSDVVMVLFENVDGDMRYLTGDNDSGLGRNARLDVKLLKGRKYMLRVRLNYSGGSGKTAVIMY